LDFNRTSDVEITHLRVHDFDAITRLKQAQFNTFAVQLDLARGGTSKTMWQFLVRMANSRLLASTRQTTPSI
jgi:hypothetical protein